MVYSYNSRKRTTVVIIVLVAVIVLCVGAIAYLSYALFWGDGEDGKIGVNIISGECKVDIVDGEDNSLLGDVLDFALAEDQTDILFAPGSTHYTEGFSVKNVGTVPVSFRISVSEDEENASAALQEAFELWITQDPENLDGGEKLTSFEGSLDVDGTSEVYYLVIRMKEEAGDEFQNQTYTGIGITVYAVQKNTSAE